MIEFRRPVQRDLNYIARNMRSMDKFECRAVGMNPKHALYFSVYDSVESMVFTAENEPLGAFGYKEAPFCGAVFWLLGTNRIRQHRQGFFLHSIRIRNQLLQQYAYLTNTICMENKESLRWLKHLGADFEDTSIERSGKVFRTFYIWR